MTLPCRRAFTLIELLVVIAIIAILAAILFPVFAQAKEAAKITAVLAQCKQGGTAVIMYGSDNEDRFPLAMGRDDNGWSYAFEPVPADNFPTSAEWGTAAVVERASSMWANSTYPYSKNYDIYAVSSNRDVVYDATDAPRVRTRTSLTMNGLLHGMSQTAVASASVVPLLWTGNGSQNVVGRGVAAPVLYCGRTEDCGFKPGAYPASDVSGFTNFLLGPGDGPTSMWVFSRHRAPMVRADSSAKTVPVGLVQSPNYIALGNGALADPLAQVNAKGYILNYWNCSFDGSGNVSPTQASTDYYCYFRPDRTQ